MKNARQFLDSAQLVYSRSDFTSASILFFKAWFALADYLLVNARGRSPKDHGERFRMLEKAFPELYVLLDKYYQVYRDTYTLTIDKSVCDEVKANVKGTVEKYKIPLSNT